MNKTSVTMLGIFVLLSISASAATEVWVARRTDGQYGSGTATDPWDAPTAARFDEILRMQVTNRTINLGAGVFATRGGAWTAAGSQPDLFNNELFDGTVIRGSGIGVTTIRLEDNANDAYVLHCLANIGPNTLRNFCSVRDLTIDCNFGNSASSSTHVVAISCRAKRVHVENVEIINVGSRGAESFGIDGYNTPVPPEAPSPSYWAIRNVIVHKIWPGSSSALSAISPAGFDVGGIVHGCKVDLSGAPSASCTGLNFAGSAQGLAFVGNTVSGCVRGVHVDTNEPTAIPPTNRGVIVMGNRLYDNDVGIGIGPVTDLPDGGKFQNMIINGNFIELWRQGSKGIELWGGCTGFQVSGNTIIKHPNVVGHAPTNTAIYVSPGASNNVIRENIIDPELQMVGASSWLSGKWANMWYDNFNTSGKAIDKAQRTLLGYREDSLVPGSTRWELSLGGWSAGSNPMTSISSSNADGSNQYAYMLFGKANGGFVTGHNVWIDPSGESGLYVGDADSGNLTVGGWITAQTGTNVKAGSKFVMQEGFTNSRMGVVALSGGGLATVNSTIVNTNSRIFLTTQVSGGTPGAVRVHARGAGWFQIKSTSTTDTSQVAWMIVDPN